MYSTLSRSNSGSTDKHHRITSVFSAAAEVEGPKRIVVFSMLYAAVPMLMDDTRWEDQVIMDYAPTDPMSAVRRKVLVESLLLLAPEIGDPGWYTALAG